MDNRLLKRLITDNKRLVLPEFGAFLKKESDEGTTLIFSPFLRKDDGVLVSEVRREFGIDTADAEAMAGEFILYIKQTVAEQGKYGIEGVGTLVKDDNGIISLNATLIPEPAQVIAAPAPQPTAFQTILQNRPEESVPVPEVAPVAQESIQQPVPAPALVQPEPQPVQQQPAPAPPIPPTPQPRVQSGATTVNTLYQQQRPQSQHFGGYQQNQPAKQPYQGQQTPTGYQQRYQAPQPVPGGQQPLQNIYQNTPQQPAVQQKKAKGKGPDLILVIMIVAALIAISVMIYAYIMEDGMSLDMSSAPAATEQVAPAPAAAPAAETPPAE